MTDKKDVTCTLTSANRVSGIIGSAPAVLVVRVKEGELDVYVSVPFVVYSYYSRYKYTTTTSCKVRFDSEQPTEEDLNTSSDYQAVFFQSPGDALAKLLNHNKMTIEIPPHDRSPDAIVFNLNGIKKRVAQIEAATGLDFVELQKREEAKKK